MGALKLWDGSAWRVVGGGPPPVSRFRRYKAVDSGGYATGGGAWAVVTFPTSDEIDAATYSYNGTTDYLTILRAGIYLVTVSAAWAADPNGTRRIALLKNDGGSLPSTGGADDAFVLDADNRAAASTNQTTNKVIGTYRFAVNDLLRVCATQTSGASLALMAGDMGGTDFRVDRLGD